MRLQHPARIQVAFDLRIPEVPQRLKFIRIIAVQEFAGQSDHALGVRAKIEGLLKDEWFVPVHGVHCYEANARACRREGKLPQNREHARHHLGFAKAREPETKIKTISQSVY